MKIKFKNPDVIIKELTREIVHQKEKNKELRNANVDLHIYINILEEKINRYEARL